ncbi:hypothetical protein EVG20_g11324 [Dentipellis fragilis]|uniref:Integrase catalytic domain-containing protein n=1 Tax=Dentipellis fragilis TaxID=205917 RepID=A0A4Y9XN50_9AGAM|nr:hypothetical protein EVG20_g11324 [Dentipellis fragilis]
MTRPGTRTCICFVGELVGSIPRTGNGLYRVLQEQDVSAAAVEEDKVTFMELHRRMGHIAPSAAKRLIENGFITGLRLDTSSEEPTFCESCIYAKAVRKSIPKERTSEHRTEFGDEVHTDVWGPAPKATLGARRYYVTFTDDATRYTHLYLLRTKDQAFEAYCKYEAWCATNKDRKIKVLHSDRGGEYLSKEFSAHLKAAGTRRKLTVHDTPEENGIAERINRTIPERARAMLHASGLPKFLWGEAMKHSTFLKNRTSTRALEGKTPYEALNRQKPNLRGLHEWGCRVWVHDPSGSKLEPRAREGRWVGYDSESKGSRVYWPSKKTITVERSVYFDDTRSSDVRLEGENLEISGGQSNEPISDSPAAPEASSSSTPAVASIPEPPKPEPSPLTTPPVDAPNPPEAAADAPESGGNESGGNESEPETGRGKRVRKPSARVRSLLAGEGRSSHWRSDPVVARGIRVPPAVVEDAMREGESDEVEDVHALVMETSDAEALEPRTLAEARRGRTGRAGTWVMENAPSGANVVGSKWVFKAKKDAAGNVVRHKARLVAQGFSQVPGVDYFDTYAPVAKLPSMRTVLALATQQDLELHQIDIKGAYLNGELTADEVIYMKHPPGYTPADAEGRVLRLRKTLYGLKQSGRRWYQKLTWIFVDRLGLVRCQVDQAVFYRRDESSTLIVAVHVDDCTIAATSKELVESFKAKVREFVEVTDLGELHWLLGIEVKRDRDARTIHLSQHSYIDSIIRRFNLEDAKPVPHLRLPEYAIMRDVPYREAVGALMYASLATRPDISFAVSTLSRFSTNPGPVHWDAVKRVFRYLKGTRELWLTYGDAERVLSGYADADGNAAEDRHAISGYAFMVNGGAVSWSSKRQEIIALSTTEAEYVAATHAAKEALWLRSLIAEIFEPIAGATTLFGDNQSAIALTQDHQYHARTKHIDIRYHFIRWIVENGSLRLIYCPTDEMVADTLTKALPSAKVKHFASELGLCTV